MNYTKHGRHAVTMIGALIIGIAASLTAAAQKSETIQATAMGTGTQLGRIVSINLRISDFSTMDERTALLQAFQEKGSKGLSNALDKMQAKGRISVTGTLGYDVNFIRSIDMPDGSRMIRFVTDRAIMFGEAWSSSRSMDYSLSMGEIIISKDKGESRGILYPVARFTLDKEKELTIETYRNPWKLNNIQLSN